MTPQDPDFSHVKAFVLDVDGVLTDGRLYCFNDGQQVRAFNIKDGYAIRNALNKGYLVAVITAKDEESVRMRLAQLGIQDVYVGAENKLHVLHHYLTTKVLDAKTVLYMGDDIPDREAMQVAGMSACPADAADDILLIASYRCFNNGGEGAVREVIEKVMKAQGNW
jgi:3-deoxy-D-manno-octulosonate 8-phosphate phosphatase (KDO 8-P phosphatase)